MARTALRKWWLPAAIGAAALAFTSSAVAQLERTRIGAWTVSSQFKGQRFDYCAMSASFAGGGRHLIFAVGDRLFTVGVVDRRWNLDDGARVNGYYQIDGGARVSMLGQSRAHYIAFALVNRAQLIDRLRGASTLHIGVAGSPELETAFAIAGSEAAFNRLSTCVSAGLRSLPARGTDNAQPTPGSNRPRPPQASAPSRPPERTRSGTGTGFYITTAGHILTADHVVRGCKTIRAQILGDAPAAATIVAASESDDLAVIRTDIKRPAGAPFRAGALRLGEPIVVYGFPLQGVLTSSGNLTTGNIAALAGIRDDHRKLQISAPVQPGNSGGPVLDMRGRVVGVVVSKLNALRAASITGDIPQNINFAIKSSVVLSFLEAHGIAVARGETNEDLQVSDVAERARLFTARIECLVQ